MSEIRAFLPYFALLIPYVFTAVHLRFVQKKLQKAAERFWLLFVMLLTAVMLYPRYSNMHWAPMLPFLAIASGIACGEILQAPTKETRLPLYQRWGLYLAIVGFLWIGPGTLNYLKLFRERENRTLIEYDGLPELAQQLTNTMPLENILLFPDDEGVGNLYYLLEKEPPRFWLMNYPWFRNEYETNKWIAAVENAAPDQVIYFTSRGPQRYPELNQFINERYQTIHQLEWEGQIVEIKAQISPTASNSE